MSTTTTNTTTTTRWMTPGLGSARWNGRAVEAEPTLRVILALVALLVGLAGSSRADEAPVAGAWRLDGAQGPSAVRRLEGEDGALSTMVDWPSRGRIGLRGCVTGATVTLAAEVAEGRGLTGAVRGDAARSRVVHLSLVGRITRDAEAGDAIAVRLLEDGEPVGGERWTRPGPARIEITSVTPEGGAWAPKSDGPLTVTFRVKNRPIAVRFRVEVSGEKSYAFYEPLVPPSRRLAGGRIALVERAADERAAAPLEPGEHTLEWDGRDDTGAKRIVLGGPCTLILEDGDAPGEVHAERTITVAPPVVRYLGPRWPRNSRQAGRDRREAFRTVTAGFQRLGFANPDEENRQEVHASDVMDALETSAAVVIATHGLPEGILLYTNEQDATEQDENLEFLTQADLELDQQRAANRGNARPYRDVHVVLLWACLAGTGVDRDDVTHRILDPKKAPDGPDAKKAPDGPEFVGLPARLRACGVDIVVAFSNVISALEHDDFMKTLLERLLQRCSIGAASRAAADFADARLWGHPICDGIRAGDPRGLAAHRAEGGATLGEALVVFPPDSQTDAERLDPACWGISTN